MRYIILLMAALILGGCGIKQQVVRVTVPDVRVNPANGPEIVVARVKDARSAADLSEYPKSTWAKNVGGEVRAGNGFNLVLASSTATQKVHEILVQSLRSMGYRTVRSCTDSCVRLDSDLKAFSASAPFSFWRAVSWTQHMLATLSVQVHLQESGATSNFTVTGKGDNIFQVVSQENWETALDRAVQDFVVNFKQAMALHQAVPAATDSGSTSAVNER